MKDYEFLAQYRMSREAFWEVVDLVKNHEVFNKKSKRKQAPPAHQLLVLFRYLGTQGNENNKLKVADHFGGIGHGTVVDYMNRAKIALSSLAPSVVCWPDEAERNEISSRIEDEFLFPNCLGLTDGTILPLEFKPTLYGEVYLTRKQNYGVHMLVICDDQARVRYYVAGWPGSVHDNRVWTLSDLCKYPARFFSGTQYILGDSAFKASPIMIPAFKKIANVGMLPENVKFNTLLAKPRVVSEHCIGMIKGRFMLMKNIRRKIRSKKDMDHILSDIQMCVILHNLLINHPPPEDWYVEETTEKARREELTNDYGLNTDMDYVASDTTRRDNLKAYLLDNFTGTNK